MNIVRIEEVARDCGLPAQKKFDPLIVVVKPEHGIWVHPSSIVYNQWGIKLEPSKDESHRYSGSSFLVVIKVWSNFIEKDNSPLKFNL